MILPILLLFLLRMIIIVQCTTQISSMDSAAYIPKNISSTFVYTGTCTECICYAFFSNNSSTYQALNCYAYNYTCLLFTNFSIGTDIRINTNSKFIFLTQLSTTTPASCIGMSNQCNGVGWNGATNCCAGLSCVYKNTSYSKCLLTSNISTVMTSTSSLPITTTTYFNDSRQNATIGLYWDCCKVSCGWPGKANFTSPPKTCAKDGVTAVNSNTQSICSNGSSYTCTNQQPWNVSNSLSYGYGGASLIGKVESAWCCGCYSLQFTSGPAIGKELVIQVINTAYTSNNLFTLQIPGGGWGTSTNGCLNQFNSSYSWGNQFNGVNNRSACIHLPSVLQAGCYWRFDWLMNTINATVRFQEVSCPSALTTLTGCIRQ